MVRRNKWSATRINLVTAFHLIYINDTDNGLHCISKFAHDSKLGNKSSNELERLQFPTDVDKQMDWAYRWKMNSNIDKWQILHNDSKNENTGYVMNSVEVQKVNEEKDLGVIIFGDLKPNK